MGVPFSRTQEGLLDFRRFGGTLHHRTAFAGASTGQQLLYALDEQVRKWEVAGKVNKYEGWEMLSLVLDDHQVCRGLIAMNLQTLELKAFKADAVIMATGGPGLDLRQVNELDDLHRQRCFGVLSAGSKICERRVYSGPSDFDSGRGQASPDVASPHAVKADASGYRKQDGDAPQSA